MIRGVIQPFRWNYAALLFVEMKDRLCGTAQKAGVWQKLKKALFLVEFSKRLTLLITNYNIQYVYYLN